MGPTIEQRLATCEKMLGIKWPIVADSPTPRFKAEDWVRYGIRSGKVLAFIPNPPNQKGLDRYLVMLENGETQSISDFYLNKWIPLKDEWVMWKTPSDYPKKSYYIWKWEGTGNVDDLIPAPLNYKLEEWLK